MFEQLTTTYLEWNQKTFSFQKRYDVIYADPPWKYEFFASSIRAVPYPELTTEELCRLPITDMVQDDCVLFLWATWPKLIDALRVGQAWGFEYKTAAFVWVKQTPHSKGWFTGMGYWTRSNTEPCLLFTKGSPKRVSKSVKEVIVDEAAYPLPLVAPVSDHSRKPPQVYEGIERLMGDVAKVELFARNTRSGWDSIGNEIDGRDIRDVLKAVA